MRRILAFALPPSAALIAAARACPAGRPDATTALADTAGDAAGPRGGCRRRCASGNTGSTASEPQAAFGPRRVRRRREKSLDVQYYIWHGDSGLPALRGALAGGRAWGAVRLLLDDLNTGGLDPRSWHSMRIRTSKCASTTARAARCRSLNFLTDFTRVNGACKQVVHRRQPGERRRRRNIGNDTSVPAAESCSPTST